ncbi:MAG: AI-2E family transporter, partial [Mesorhizobium sp.]
MAKAPERATPRTTSPSRATPSRASADRAAPARTPDHDGAVIAADDSSGALRRQVLFWLATAVLLALFLYVFSGILLPFVAGMVLAYFLDPVADWLQRLGLSRLMATVVILIAFIVVVVLAFVILVPVLATQMADFARKLPEYLTRLQSLLTSFDP